MSRPGEKINDDRVVSLTKAGKSAAEIAVIMDCKPRTVVRARHRAGISKLDAAGTGWSEEIRAEAERMLDDGASYAEVSRTLHIDRDHLSRKYPGRGWTLAQSWNHAIDLRRTEKRMKEVFPHAAGI